MVIETKWNFAVSFVPDILPMDRPAKLLALWGPRKLLVLKLVKAVKRVGKKSWRMRFLPLNHPLRLQCLRSSWPGRSRIQPAKLIPLPGKERAGAREGEREKVLRRLISRRNLNPLNLDVAASPSPLQKKLKWQNQSGKAEQQKQTKPTDGEPSVAGEDVKSRKRKAQVAVAPEPAEPASSSRKRKQTPAEASKPSEPASSSRKRKQAPAGTTEEVKKTTPPRRASKRDKEDAAKITPPKVEIDRVTSEEGDQTFLLQHCGPLLVQACLWA